MTDELEDWLNLQSRISRRFTTKAAIIRLALTRLRHLVDRGHSLDSLSEHLPRQPAARDGRPRPRAPAVKLQFFTPKRKRDDKKTTG